MNTFSKHLLFFIAFSSFSFGQNTEQSIASTHQIEDFVVTASRFEKTLSELSPSVSVFSKEEIKDGHYLNLRDLLNEVPGLHLASNGGMGKVTSMFTRGSESNHTAILLNGRRMPTGSSGLYDLGNLGLSNVRSIEVVRGDNSSLYGGAIGGVVNIRSNFSDNGTNQNLKLERGSEGAKFLNYNYGFSDERLNLSFSLNSTYTDGYQENSAFDRDSKNLYFIYKLNDIVDLDFQYLQYDATVGVRGSIFDWEGNLKPPASEVNKTKSFMYSPSLVFNVSDSSNLKITSNISKNELTALDTGFYDRRFTETIDSIESVFETVNFRDKGKSILGLLYEKRKYHESPVNILSTSYATEYEVEYDTRSLFTNSIYQINSHSELEFGGRIDSYSNNFDTSKSGSLKYTKNLNDEANTSIHAKYSYGKNPPDLLTLAYGDPYSEYGYSFFLTDSNIELETIRSREIGFKTDIGNHEFGFVYFDNNIYDLSQYISKNKRGLINSSQKGSESYLSGNLPDNIKYNISYSYLDAVDEEGKQLIRRPKHKWIISVSKVIRDIKMGLSLIKISGLTDNGNIELNDYSVVRFSSSYSINDMTSIHFRVENALNEKYDYLIGFPAAPKQGYLGITYKF